MGARYIFRMDDITHDMDWDNFYKFLDLFQRYNIKPLLGIVPANKDSELSKQAPKEDFWKIMRELQRQGRVELAQHGYEHVYSTREAGLLGKYGCFPQSEFAGLAYEEQYRKIKAGQEILKQEGIHTTIWMAPSHTFDLNTLKALKDLGFKMITDGIALYPYYFRGLLFVPQQMWNYEYQPVGIGTICLHTNHLDNHFLEAIENSIKKGMRTIDFSSLRGFQVSYFQIVMNLIYRAWYLGRNRVYKLKTFVKQRWMLKVKQDY